MTEIIFYPQKIYLSIYLYTDTQVIGWGYSIPHGEKKYENKIKVIGFVEEKLLQQHIVKIGIRLSLFTHIFMRDTKGSRLVV